MYVSTFKGSIERRSMYVIGVVEKEELSLMNLYKRRWKESINAKERERNERIGYIKSGRGINRNANGWGNILRQFC